MINQSASGLSTAANALSVGDRRAHRIGRVVLIVFFLHAMVGSPLFGADPVVVHNFANRKFVLGTLDVAPNGSFFGAQAPATAVYSSRYQARGYNYFWVGTNGAVTFPGGANFPASTITAAIAGPDGRLYVGATSNVFRIEPTTAGSVTSIATLPNSSLFGGDAFAPSALAFDPDGVLHASLWGSLAANSSGGPRRRIGRLNTSAQFSLITPAYQAGIAPFTSRDRLNDQLVFHSDGFLYQSGIDPVAANYSLHRAPQAGGSMEFLASWSSPPKSLKSGPDGNLYWLVDPDGAGPVAAELMRLAPGGVVTTVANLGSATKLALAPNGFYFLDGQNVGLVTLGGEVTEVVPSEASVRFVDLATDATGRLHLGVSVPTGDEIWRIEADGGVTKLAVLPNETDGEVPIGPLARAVDGFFYGVTLAGGGAQLGTFYRVSPAGVYEAVADFTRPTAPDDIDSPLVAGPDGNLYFLGNTGEAAGRVYRVTPGAVVSIAPIAHSGDYAFDENAFLFTSGGVLHVVSGGAAPDTGARIPPAILRLPLNGAETVVAEIPTEGFVTGAAATPNGDITVLVKNDPASPAGRLLRFRSTGAAAGEHSFPIGRGPAGLLIGGNDNAVYGFTTTYPGEAGDGNRQDFFRFTTDGRYEVVVEGQLGELIDSDRLLGGDGSVFLAVDDDGIYAIDTRGSETDRFALDFADSVQWLSNDRVLGIKTRGSPRLTGQIFVADGLRPAQPPPLVARESAPGPVKLKSRKPVETSKSAYRLKGTVLNFTSGARLEYKAGRLKGKGRIKASGKFALKVKLGEGRNVVKVRAVSVTGLRSKWAKAKVTKL